MIIACAITSGTKKVRRKGGGPHDTARSIHTRFIHHTPRVALARPSSAHRPWPAERTSGAPGRADPCPSRTVPASGVSTPGGTLGGRACGTTSEERRPPSRRKSHGKNVSSCGAKSPDAESSRQGLRARAKPSLSCSAGGSTEATSSLCQCAASAPGSGKRLRKRGARAFDSEAKASTP